MEPILKISHSPTQVPPTATVCDAVQRMVKDRVGAAAVLNPDQSLAGIFTERDLMTRVVAKHLDPETTTVAEAMTSGVVTISKDTPIEKALEIMVSRHFRHLPIMDGGKVIAMATVRQVLKHKLDQEEEELEAVVNFFTSDGIGG